MEFKGSSVYDQTDFLTNYLERRSREESPNNAIEKPIIYELLKEVEGKHVLDLGCGDAVLAVNCLRRGLPITRGSKVQKQWPFWQKKL